MTAYDILDYSTSPFNPLLKFVIVVLFIATFALYYDTRKKIGGEIRKSIDLLLLFSIFMALASLFRYFGHGTEFGFNADYSLKWFQSLAYLFGSVCFILAAYRLFSLFRRNHD